MRVLLVVAMFVVFGPPLVILLVQGLRNVRAASARPEGPEAIR